MVKTIRYRSQTSTKVLGLMISITKNAKHEKSRFKEVLFFSPFPSYNCRSIRNINFHRYHRSFELEWSLRNYLSIGFLGKIPCGYLMAGETEAQRGDIVAQTRNSRGRTLLGSQNFKSGVFASSFVSFFFCSLTLFRLLPECILF